MTKLTYKDANKKKAIRDFLVSHFPFQSIVGLPGPDMQDYLQWCENHGFTQIEAWEKEPAVAITQLSKRIPKQISYHMGDIIDAIPDSNDTLYDLDFCSTLATLDKHVNRFKKNYIMTFSRRLRGGMDMSNFLKVIGEKPVYEKHYKSPIDHTIYKTNKKSEFIYAEYWDTSAMCCIAKIK